MPHARPIPRARHCGWRERELAYDAGKLWCSGVTLSHLLSREHVANSSPVELHATDLTSFSWPSSVAICSSSNWAVKAKTVTIESKLAQASWRPSGLHSQERTVRVENLSHVPIHFHSTLPAMVGAHKRTEQSPEQVARRSLVGCQAPCHTRSLCPERVNRSESVGAGLTAPTGVAEAIINV